MLTTNITSRNKLTNVMVYIWLNTVVLALALHLLTHVFIGDILVGKSLE